MKSFLLTALILSGSFSAMAEDLPQESVLQVRYKEVPIYEVTSVTSEMKYLPGTPNTMPSLFYDLQHTEKLSVARIPIQTGMARGMVEVLLTVNGADIKAETLKLTTP